MTHTDGISTAVRLLGLALGLAVVGPVFGQEGNIVTNGGFELFAGPGMPVDWSVLGRAEEAADAHSGERAIRLIRGADEEYVETGLNRVWQPNDGKQGTMLDRLSGGLVLWYKLESASPSARIDIHAIPMSAAPIENTLAARVSFPIPLDCAGDGQWHEGRLAYDFTDHPEVKWVHISPRILGGAASLLLDDFSWRESVGPVLVLDKATIGEDARRPGDRATISVEARNIGDAVADDATVTAELPEGLRVPGGGAVAKLERVAPKGKAPVRWTIDGRRNERTVVRLVARAGELESSFPVRFEPGIAADQLETSRFIIAKGERVAVSCWVTNTGHVVLSNVGVTLQVPEPFKRGGAETQRIRSLAPGARVPVTWQVSAPEESPGVTLHAVVAAEGIDDAQVDSFIMATARAQGALPAEFGAGANESMAVVSNETVRLLFPKSSYGYGTAEIYIRGGGPYHLVGRMPRLGKLVLAGEGGPEEHLLFADAAQADGSTLTFTKALTDGAGRTWDLTWTVKAEPEQGYATFSTRAKCSAAVQVLALEGPMIYWGEGAFGALKREAVFPGLEWLVDGEPSSNALDMNADVRDRIRYVPHANMVTIPLMSLCVDDFVVGLLWDQRQKWDGVHDRPSAVFASPDTFEGKQAHLTGLFLPSTTEWVPMNARVADKPYELQPDTELSLSAQVFAKAPATDALVAMDQWFQLYGVPEPAPIPRGSYRDEVAFSMQAYLKSLWVEDEETWWTSRGGGTMSGKGRAPGFVYDLRMGALLSSDPALAEACKALADRVAAKGVPSVGDDLGLRFGVAAQALPVEDAQIAPILDARGSDGLWRFDADLVGAGVFEGFDYHTLGPDNALEVGTVAHNAWVLIRSALLTGDDSAYQAALPALEAMRVFVVPRAAQVWEVPVHAPDILAASDAVDAYVAAYEYSGDEAWLAEAAKWARKGLPFLYMWQDEKQPFVLYGSIPVYGASLMAWSWIGRPVQWNGLRYAWAVTKLAQYDRSFPWRRVAEGVVHSALYQQATEGDNIALWPDSQYALNGEKASWVFPPAMILEHIYSAVGYEPEPKTRIVRGKAGNVHVSALSDIGALELSGGVLSFRIRYAEGDHGLVLVSGTADPRYVVVDKAELPRAQNAQDLLAQPDGAFLYAADRARLAIWIPRSGRHDIAIEGVTPQKVSLLPAPMRGIDFGFDADAQGWTPATDLKPFEVAGGLLRLTATGPDPFATRARVTADGNAISKVRVRMKTAATGQAQFYWVTKDSPGYAEDKVVPFELAGGDAFVDYDIPVGEHALWKGHTITGIRLDFCNGQPGATAEVDFIRGVR